MAAFPQSIHPGLLDERSPTSFRVLFGDFLTRSRSVDTAILRVRLSAVDLSARELRGIESLRVLVAEVNAQTVEGEAFALAMDPSKGENLTRVLNLLQTGVMEIRSAPLGGWGPRYRLCGQEADGENTPPRTR